MCEARLARAQESVGDAWDALHAARDCVNALPESAPKREAAEAIIAAENHLSMAFSLIVLGTPDFSLLSP